MVGSPELKTRLSLKAPKLHSTLGMKRRNIHDDIIILINRVIIIIIIIRGQGLLEDRKKLRREKAKEHSTHTKQAYGIAVTEQK